MCSYLVKQPDGAPPTGSLRSRTQTGPSTLAEITPSAPGRRWPPRPAPPPGNSLSPFSQQAVSTPLPQTHTPRSRRSIYRSLQLHRYTATTRRIRHRKPRPRTRGGAWTARGILAAASRRTYEGQGCHAPERRAREEMGAGPAVVSFSPCGRWAPTVRGTLYIR